MKQRRICMTLAGVIICAVSIGVFKYAALGLDPFQSFMGGLENWIPISYGTLYVIVNLLLLGFGLLTDRHNIGINTFINLFFLGYIVQFTQEQMQFWIPDPSLAVRVLCFIGAIITICVGSSLYMTADLGVSTYDAVAIVLAEKWKLGKFKYCRIGTDMACILIGCFVFVASGGGIRNITAIVGVGTVVTAFFMGPLISFFNGYFQRFLDPATGKTES